MYSSWALNQAASWGCGDSHRWCCPPATGCRLRTNPRAIVRPTPFSLQSSFVGLVQPRVPLLALPRCAAIHPLLFVLRARTVWWLLHSPQVEQESTQGNHHDAPEEPPSLEEAVVAVGGPHQCNGKVRHGATTDTKNASPEQLPAAGRNATCRGCHALCSVPSNSVLTDRRRNRAPVAQPVPDEPRIRIPKRWAAVRVQRCCYLAIGCVASLNS
jgi:hypothetical protein